MTNYEEKKHLTIFSKKIAEIIVCENGIKNLVNIRYFKPENSDENKKAYIFTNTPETYATFAKYAFKDNNNGTNEAL